MIKFGLVYDVVFLDIEMETMDGFRVAEILNEKQSQCVLSFITTHAELAVDGYDYSFRFYIPTQGKNVGFVKAYVWSSFGEIKPLAETKTLSFTE